MSPKFYLTIQTHDGNNYQIQYQLDENPISLEWFKKIKHIWRVPLDQVYTTVNDNTTTSADLNKIISTYILELNESIGKVYDIKEEYTQTDCNVLHSFTVKDQYHHPVEIRNIFHKLHRKIHHLELLLSNQGVNQYSLAADWGEKAGPLTTKHKQSLYQHYTLEMLAGNIYHVWVEFGKTPYEYWKNQDDPKVNHFIDNCKPHTTFRPGFSLCTKDKTFDPVDEDFESWFDDYRDAWQKTYNADPMSAYSQGGVQLARPVDNQFDYATAYKIISIDL